MRHQAILIAVAMWAGLLPVQYALAANPPNFIVVPGIQDPADTDLVNALWVGGLGCPTAARIAPPSTSPYSDPACNSAHGGGDATDVDNEGLLLIKTGPTSNGPANNNALSGATLVGVQGIQLTELGYDIRAGSVCDAVAPRFDIFTMSGKYYQLHCSDSLVPPTPTPGTGWTRLRWNHTGGIMAIRVSTGTTQQITEPISSILIIYDEGQESPHNSGLAILDNIDVNGRLVGKR